MFAFRAANDGPRGYIRESPARNEGIYDARWLDENIVLTAGLPCGLFGSRIDVLFLPSWSGALIDINSNYVTARCVFREIP